jgi:hypothetical protein
VSGWRLYFQGLDAERLGGTFIREGQMLDKQALRQMRRVSKLVMEQSIKNSPVDWKGPHGRLSPPGHELEKAHHIVEEVIGRRIVATVEVGGMVGDVDVDLYASWIHNSFDYKLGPASRAKEMMGSDYKVGPLFLDRALAEYESEFEALVDDVIEGLLL